METGKPFTGIYTEPPEAARQAPQGRKNASLGRKPQEDGIRDGKSPAGATEVPEGKHLSPFAGLCEYNTLSPGLAPWARNLPPLAGLC